MKKITIYKYCEKFHKTDRIAPLLEPCLSKVAALRIVYFTKKGLHRRCSFVNFLQINSKRINSEKKLFHGGCKFLIPGLSSENLGVKASGLIRKATD